jgi:hypothetical protein
VVEGVDGLFGIGVADDEISRDFGRTGRNHLDVDAGFRNRCEYSGRQSPAVEDAFPNCGDQRDLLDPGSTW